jgi:hypothetical protein
MQQEVTEAPVSEEQVDTGSVAQEQPQRQVPLQALEAERHKRQDAEKRNAILEEYALRYQQLQEQMNKPKVEDSTDDDDLVNKRELKQFHQKLGTDDLAKLKREISEDMFKEVNPEAMTQINTHLKLILERKPWLVQSIESAPNRYSRAYEIVQDYAPQIAAKSAPVSEAKKIVENAKKPGSPVAAAKSANLSNVDYLRSIAGTKEFKDYRTKLLQGK